MINLNLTEIDISILFISNTVRDNAVVKMLRNLRWAGADVFESTQKEKLIIKNAIEDCNIVMPVIQNILVGRSVKEYVRLTLVSM